MLVGSSRDFLYSLKRWSVFSSLRYLLPAQIQVHVQVAERSARARNEFDSPARSVLLFYSSMLALHYVVQETLSNEATLKMMQARVRAVIRWHLWTEIVPKCSRRPTRPRLVLRATRQTGKHSSTPRRSLH